jgi:hypothetical protein
MWSLPLSLLRLLWQVVLFTDLAGITDHTSPCNIQEAQLTAIVTSAGTLVLGLSWLIGASLTEVLTSIIFLFVKHPFDVGDRVDLEKASYTVKEIRLLSTIFLDSRGVYVQAPNVHLNAMVRLVADHATDV